MTDVGLSTVETWITDQVTTLGGNAAVILTATILLGIGIFLVFWGINKVKGGLG
jgi:uncharacterized membrane protein